MRRDDSSDEDLMRWRPPDISSHAGTVRKRDYPKEVHDIVDWEYENKPVHTTEELRKTGKILDNMKWDEESGKSPKTNPIAAADSSLFLMAGDQERWEEEKRKHQRRSDW